MSQPTAQEQLTLEYINLLRTNPGGEYGRLTSAASLAEIQGALSFFGVNMAALQSQLNALTAVAPLAWNNNLATAARTHTGLMIQFDQQSHQLPGEAGLGDRITAAGYTGWSNLGENVFAFSSSAFYGHAGFVVDWGYDTEDFNGNTIRPNFASLGDGIQDPPGHRITLTSASYTEIGIGITLETNPNTQVGTLVTTHDLGNRFNYQAQFLGVVINDLDNDNFYDIGEGLGGITITLTSGSNVYTTTSWDAGGWQISVPAGNYQIVFSGGALNGTITRTASLGTLNVKIDAELGDASGGGGGGEGARIRGTNDANTLNGTAFDDVINALGGDDILNGNGGNDSLNGDTGSDTMRGGAGNDSYTVDNLGDTVIELADQGTDSVRSTVSFTLGANVEELVLQGGTLNGTGNALGNMLFGSNGVNTLTGLGGNDVIRGLRGADILSGGEGNDNLNGGEGFDTLTGGAGVDRFLFRFLEDSSDRRQTADIITDFDQSLDERIQVNLIDSNTTLAGDQDFEWIGAGAFTNVAGQMRYQQVSGNTFIEGDVNGDGVSDFTIRLNGLYTLDRTDFIGVVDMFP